MRLAQKALLLPSLVVALIGANGNFSFAQNKYTPGGSQGAGQSPSRGFRGGGIIGIITTIPGGKARSIDDGTVRAAPRGKRRLPQRATRPGPSGVPPANENRMVLDEVLVEVPNNVSSQIVNAIQRRHRLTLLERQTFQFSGSILIRWRIPDRRSVATVVRQLESDSAILSAQPNYLFALQQSDATVVREGDPLQYELGKLHLLQAHALAKGDNVLVAIVDSGVDASHPELAGSIAGTFDAVAFLPGLNKHGTAIAGLIAAHRTLMGSAPKARLLVARVFGPTGSGSTFNILKGLDWAATSGARIINMSFAGPFDPVTHRFLEFAHKKGIILIAAAGNAGPRSPPLYPGADANVIAVTATDARDDLFAQANRGHYIAVAAPGVELLVAIPNSAFEISSGTSYSAAEVTGVAALILQRKPDLSPDQVRAILRSTAMDLGPKGRDSLFGAKLINAYGALMAEPPLLAAEPPQPGEQVRSGR